MTRIAIDKAIEKFSDKNIFIKNSEDCVMHQALCAGKNVEKKHFRRIIFQTLMS